MKRFFCFLRSFAAAFALSAVFAGSDALAATPPKRLQVDSNLLGQSYEAVKALFTSCDSSADFFSLTCRASVFGQPADVLMRFGAARLVQQVSVHFVSQATVERTIGLYQALCEQLRPQFSTVSEERTKELVRRTFIQPNVKTATALLMPGNALPNQVTVDMSLLPPASP